MALPQITVNVRLTPELAAAFEHLKDSIPGLPKGALLRSLLADQFAKPMDEQIEIVTKQLLKPGVRKKTRHPGAGTNAKSRLPGA